MLKVLCLDNFVCFSSIENDIAGNMRNKEIVLWLILISYIIISRLMAFFSQRRAFLFNAEFENHTKMVYARLVVDNPAREEHKVTIPL